MDVLDYIRSNAVALPQLTKFAIGMVVLFGVLAVSRRLRLPAVVGLLFTGVIVGPHVLQVFGEQRPIADFFGDLGKLLLMFFAGLEIDLALFRRSLRKTVTFGLITTSIPLLLGTAVGLLFGYRFVTAVVLGSLLASHTLLGMSIVTKIGANRLEPFIVTVGATVLSDMLSLVVFAMCVSTYQRGFSPSGLALQLIEIAAFVPLLLLGLGRAGKYLLKKVEDDEQACFILMFGIMGCAVALARVIQLPGIVGAFLAGRGGQQRRSPGAGQGEAGVHRQRLLHPDILRRHRLSDRSDRVRAERRQQFRLGGRRCGCAGHREGIAAAIAARLFNYTSAARMTVWSLTLPQVAATLAATLVGFDTFNPAGERLIDQDILNVVFVLILVTATAGPIMTQHYAPLMLASSTDDTHHKAA
jgi:Kef-type K+ transport system membrane component KefB